VRNDTFSDGVGGQCGGSVRIQLAHDIGAVPVDGSRADAQVRPDLRAGMALSDHLEHLQLALGQIVPVQRMFAVLDALEISAEHFVGNFGAEIFFAFKNATYGGQQFGMRVFFKAYAPALKAAMISSSSE
jgi:hypothetical protein